MWIFLIFRISIIILHIITFFNVIYFSSSNTQSIGRGEIYRLHIQPSESDNSKERYFQNSEKCENSCPIDCVFELEK
jgi:hypothetical protein